VDFPRRKFGELSLHHGIVIVRSWPHDLDRDAQRERRRLQRSPEVFGFPVEDGRVLDTRRVAAFVLPAVRGGAAPHVADALDDFHRQGADHDLRRLVPLDESPDFVRERLHG
jgi:hypothetical protein